MKLGNSLSVIWQIFRRDLLRLLKNPIALIIVLGVLFLPSVYAWLTIGADWDPYQRTGALKVGIASQDTGAENQLVGHINIGDEVVAKLRDDHHLGWQFVDEKQAMDGVYSGEYYASIVIPADFSQDFLSVFNGDFTKPTINYYVNEKISAVAPELTDSGATTVETEINSQFISTVSQTVVEMAQKTGTELDAAATNATDNLESDLHAINQDVQNVSGAINNFDSELDSAKYTILEAKDILAHLQATLPQIENNLETAQNGLNSENTENKQNLTELINGLEQASEELSKIQTEVQSSELPSGVKQIIAAKITEANNKLNSLTATFSGQILPNSTAAFNQFSGAFATLTGMVASLNPIFASTESALDQLSSTLDLAKTAGQSVEASLGAISYALGDAETNLASLSSSASVQKLAEFLKVSPDAISDFMAAPVTLKTETLYPIKNYGTGVAPFFTNIALWVAGFVLVAILHLNVDPKGLPKFSVTEAYFGRLLLFVLLGILQAIIVCTGDLIMGIQCANPAAYLFAGVISVIVYVNIMYALVYTMRHIGRAIGVVILIMQIPGASGEYPVQMMPQFFQAIHPFLPFTYSIDAMREATGGMYGNQYWIDLLCLIPFLVLALVLGLVAGRRAFNLNALFDEELSATDLLITEPVGQVEKHFKLRVLIQALLNSKSYRQLITARATKFSRRYPILKRIGLVMLIIVPIAMLLVNIVLPHDPETKLILLLLMVLAIIAIAVYLIVIEFINANLKNQLQLSSMNQKELKATARKKL